MAAGRLAECGDSACARQETSLGKQWRGKIPLARVAGKGNDIHAGHLRAPGHGKRGEDIGPAGYAAAAHAPRAS